MKKKKMQPFIVLITLLVILAGTFFVLKNNNSKNEDETEEYSETLINADAAGISTLTITNNQGTMEFTYDSTSSAWKYAPDKEFPLDDTKVSSITDSLSEFKAQRRLEDTLENIAEYGLDNPAYTLKISGDTNVTLYIGNKTSTGNYYAYIDGSEIVYTIDSTLPDSLNVSLNDMAVMDTVPSITDSDVYGMVINGTQYDYFESGNQQYDYTLSNNWFAKDHEGKYIAMDTTAVNEVITAITGMSYTGCAKYKASGDELTQYGLDDENKKTVTVKYKETQSSDETETKEESSDDSEVKVEKEFSFDIGSQNEDGDYYVKAADSNMINIVSKDSIESILKDTSQLVTKNAFGINSSNVTSLKADVKGTSYDLIENGAITDSSKYEAVYNEIYELQAETVIEDGNTILPVDSELTLTYNTSVAGFETVTMEFTKYNGSYYQATINGDTKLLVLKTKIDSIISQLGNITP